MNDHSDNQAPPGSNSAGAHPLRLIVTIIIGVGLSVLYFNWSRLAPTVGLSDEVAGYQFGQRLAGVLFWIVSARAAIQLVNQYCWGGWGNRRRAETVPKLLKDLTSTVFWIAAIVVIVADVFGVAVTGFLTASGIVLAVIGFALRGIIADLFTGIALGIEQPIARDDWIELDDGKIGRVDEMNWRATRIVTREDLTIIIPNSYLAATPFINFHAPQKYWRDKFDIVLQYDVTAEQAERLLLSAVSRIPESMNIPREPEVRILEYTERGTRWELRYWVPNYPDMPRFREEVQRNVLHNLHVAGIHVPRDKMEILNATHPMARRDRLEEDLALLREMELFDGFEEGELRELCAGLGHRLALKGEPVVRQGEAGNSLFIVKEGFLEVSLRRDDGTDIIVGHQIPGAFFGEMSLLTGEARMATVTPTVDSVVLEIAHGQLAPLLTRRPEAVTLLSQVLADRQTRNDRTLQEQPREAAAAHHATLVQRLQTRIGKFFDIRHGATPQLIKDTEPS